MADTKISAATLTTPATTDLIPLERPASAVARYATVAALVQAQAASTTATGAVELATVAEAKAGTSAALAVTPAGLAYAINSVEYYGAVGDGVTDDTAAIQAAIATGTILANKYGQSRAGRIKIQLTPGKIYRCNSPINLCYMQGIELDGGSPIMGAVIDSHAAGKAAIECIGSQNISFRNLEIYGDQTDAPAVGIMVSRSTGTHGSNGVQIRFDNVLFYGYYVSACYYGVETESNWFYACSFTPASVGDAVLYYGANNDLSLIPDNATLLGGGYGPYNTKFMDCSIVAPGNSRAIYIRDGQIPCSTVRDCYIYGNSATIPTIEIEGSGTTVFDNVFFEGTPGTRVKYTYNASYVNYMFGQWRDITWSNAQDYLIYADDNTDLRNMSFTGFHTMSAYDGVYAPVSVYDTYLCDYRGLAYYQGEVFDIAVRNNSIGCNYRLSLDDTVTIAHDYGNLVEDFSTSLKPKLEMSSYYGLLKLGGAWNGGHLIMGAAHLWLDGSGNLRVNYSGAPANDTDGTIIGP